jgi:hypothetical protein
VTTEPPLEADASALEPPPEASPTPCYLAADPADPRRPSSPPEQGYLRGIEVVSALSPLNRTSFLSESMSTSPS